MVAVALKLVPALPAPTAAPTEHLHIVRDMAMQLVADRVDLSDDDNPDIIMSLHAAGWRWHQIKPHLDAAVLEAKQIILMREMGLEP